MKPLKPLKPETLTVEIDRRLKDKMLGYYQKTRKSLKLQVSEALNLYFDSQRPL
jgi:hypothetical protein